VKVPRTCASTVFSLTNRLAPIAVGTALRHQREDLALTVREIGDRVDRAPATDELRDHLGVDGGTTLPDAAHRVSEPLQIRHPVLQHVPGATGAVPEQIHRMLWDGGSTSPDER
jgi:hypothetical protein